MRKIFLIIAVLFLIAPSTQAQFIRYGKIKFERRTSIKLQAQNTWESEMGNAEYIKQLPSGGSSYFELIFTPDESLYKFVEHEKLAGWASYFLSSGIAKENTVYRDLVKDSITARKKFYESEFVIKTQPASPKWKIDDEMRVIAGYNCRKAVSTINDSIVIVAFFTEEIIPQSGPESITGLPGMVLGLAIPKLYTTWFATEVTSYIPKPEELKPNFKGKITTIDDAEKQIEKATKNWGAWGGLFKVWLNL